MTLRDDMAALTAKTIKTGKKKKEEARKKATAKAKRNGKKRAKEIIEGLPKRINEAAKKGESHVYEWCFSGSESGRYMLVAIWRWAEQQHFETKFERNCEGANEGQDNVDNLIISWE